MAAFAWYETYAEQEAQCKDAIREVTKELETRQRAIDRLLQLCHAKKPEQLKDTFVQVRALFDEIKSLFSKLATTFNLSEYYRFHGLWRNVTQNLVFNASLLVYLESEKLITLEEFQELVGEKGQGFHVDLEDFLYGICSLPAELARLAPNCVIMGDNTRPQRINQFVAELNNGFRMLNLKNDGLRKKFDSLKYDVKKIESVIYDLSIRGLLNSESS